jgi:hypothetical protein
MQPVDMMQRIVIQKSARITMRASSFAMAITSFFLVLYRSNN